MIRVCFRYNDRRWASRLICAVRGGDTAHCEVAWCWEGDLHGCVSSSFLDGGVRGKEIVMPAAKWRIYEVPGSPAGVLAWLGANDHRGYGWLRLLRWLLPLRLRVGGPVCSQACAEMLDMPEPWLFDPRTLEAAVAWCGARIQ